MSKVLGAVSQQKEIAQLKDQLDRAVALRESRFAAWTNASRLVGNLEKYLQGFNQEVAPYTRKIDLAPKKNLSLADAIEERRRRIRELAADRRRVEAAPKPSGWVKQQVAEWVKLLSERGSPNLLPLIEIGRMDLVRMPEISVGETLHGIANLPSGAQAAVTVGGQFRVPDALALLSWLDGPKLLKRLNEEITALSDDEHALSDAQRAEQLSQIANDRLATEREEEALVEQGEAEGATIMRRADADPRAVLSLASSLPSPRET